MKTQETSNRKPNIFVLEDNEDIGYILEYYLREEGFVVKLFTTLSDFHAAFKREVPDLLLVDVRLPDGNGIELCGQIKHDQRTANLPVLVMSAHSSEVESKACHADIFIPKPFDLSFLLSTIKQYLPAA